MHQPTNGLTVAHVVVDIEGPTATITIDRQEKRNAITLPMLASIIEAADRIADSDTRAVILRGAGDVFSAGIDVQTLGSGPLLGADPDRRYDAARLGRTAVEAIAGLSQITIAALNGVVVGGGLVLAAACDFRIAAPDTRFAIPEIDLGIPLAWGGIERLVHEIGPSRTKELVMTGRWFTAEEAAAWGLVTTVAVDEQVHDTALALAQTIGAKARFPVTTTKRHVAEVVAGDSTRDDAMGLIAALEDRESSERRKAYLGRFIGHE